MDDAALVRGLERLGNLARDGEDVGQASTLGVGRGRGGDDLSQRRARDELHDEVVGPDVVERADVRVVERGNRARFALESLAEFGRRNLDRDVAAETGVASPIDLAHSACPDGPVYLGRSEPFAGLKGHAVAILAQRRLRA